MAKKSANMIAGIPLADFANFNPMVIKREYGVREQRAMYSALRDVAQKRLHRLAASGIPSELYTKYSDFFVKSAFIDTRDLPFMLTELKYFLSAKTSTVSGLRAQNERIIKTLQSEGISVNQRNLAQFGAFMDAVRSAHLDKIYSSDAAATLWDSIQTKRISWKQVVRQGLSDFMANAYRLEDIELPTGTRKTAANYRKALLRDDY